MNTNVSLQSLWTEDPDGWIASCEARFDALNITDDKQKYHHLICALNKDQLIAVQHIHSVPYSDGHLEKLKSSLITTYKPTKDERMYKLLTKSSLDFGQRPSSAFRQMMNWGDGMVDRKLIMSLWSKLLPENIAPTVSQYINYENLNDDKIRQILESADELVARHTDRKYVHDYARNRSNQSSSCSSRSNKSYRSR
ncbi:hypothetical protein BLA29_010969, partial [Euroglyphus maynei]